MTHTNFKALEYFTALYADNTALQQCSSLLTSRGLSVVDEDIDKLTQNYQDAIRLIETALWSDDNHVFNESHIEQFQQLYRELERLISLKSDDRRHKFIITIPVADRPQHLQSCLDSLLSLCQIFHYGGSVNGMFTKVVTIIADDSKEAYNISQNREIVERFNQAGVETIYFGQREQLQQLDRLSDAERTRLRRVLGDIDRRAFYHKGASIMRNLAYLKLRELTQGDERTLCYFIDSDQEFRVKVASSRGDRDLYAISFLHDLDRIFTQESIEVLTGKVVGDPPVSPSVMAGNFLDDVLAFLHRNSVLDPADSCQFHNQRQQRVDDAAYHDMADLFGFTPASESYHYNCPLTNSHDHKACFQDFADKLNRFFDGEHPTRKTYYEHQELISSITTARTIYTGNYIFRPAALDYFIPFATLKLRMAGPVLGRIIKSELGEKFVSANLPMLHKRTVEDTGQSEFRPGINRNEKCIDLSGEFERQFFGDVMLFTMEKLTADGYPKRTPTEEHIAVIVRTVETSMQQIYLNKQKQIIGKIDLLKSIFNDPRQWWQGTNELSEARERFSHFIANIEHNFGQNATAYELIESAENRARRFSEIVDAIYRYSDDRANWHSSLIN